MPPRLRAAAVASLAGVALASCASPSTPTANGASTVETSGSTRPPRSTSGIQTPTQTSRPTPTSQPSLSAPTSPAATTGRSPTRTATAIAALATLIVKGRAPKTGYTRAQFGAAWTDDNAAPLGHNGCDTRNDILRRDLTAIALKAGSNGCTVATGILADPYIGRRIAFTRGAATSTAIQIDHVVALSDAWQKGAQPWPRDRRVAFANDPINLLAVDGPTNEAKGDGDAATWLPPNKAYRCAYVARQVAVKARYQLAVTAAERSAIAAVLASCPGQSAPTETGSPPVNPRPTSAPATTTVRPTPTTAAPDPPNSVYYANCAAVRAAGQAPLYRGQPGYRGPLDRDGDGVACE